MLEANSKPASPQEITERGEAIYREKYQRELERTAPGKFVAINVKSGEASVADASEVAVKLALEKDPDGLLFLARVGHKAAFEAGWYMSSVG